MPPKHRNPACGGRAAAGIAENSGLEHPVSKRFPPKNPALALDLAEISFQRAVAKLHRLGPRPLAEFLAELGARHLLRTEIEAAVDSFASRLNPAMIDAAAGRHFAPLPLHLIGGVRC